MQVIEVNAFIGQSDRIAQVKVQIGSSQSSFTSLEHSCSNFYLLIHRKSPRLRQLRGASGHIPERSCLRHQPVAMQHLLQQADPRRSELDFEGALYRPRHKGHRGGAWT